MLDVRGRPRRIVATIRERHRVVKELLAQGRTLLDDYKPYIHQRFTQGCRNASQLHREIRDQGLPGDRSVVNSYVRLLKQGTVTAPPPPALPKPRRALRWITTLPEHLRPDQAVGLKEVRVACPELDAAVDHVRAFGALMHDHRGEDLHKWIELSDSTTCLPCGSSPTDSSTIGTRSSPACRAPAAPARSKAR